MSERVQLLQLKRPRGRLSMRAMMKELRSLTVRRRISPSRLASRVIGILPSEGSRDTGEQHPLLKQREGEAESLKKLSCLLRPRQAPDEEETRRSTRS